MSPSFSIFRDNVTAPRGAVIAIGNFDGVHRGHRAVIEAAIRMAREAGKPAYAVTFEPHPRVFFQPNVPQFRLTDETTKLRLLAGTGLDGAVVMTFDATRAGTAAVDFIQQDLVDRLAVSGIAVGYDFHFGKGRAGSPALLKSEGEKLGIPVHVEERREVDGVPVSSSSIRTALGEGNIKLATTLLGDAMARQRTGAPRREARPRPRLSHRQYRARSRLRAAPRHLCGARRPRLGADRRRRELRHGGRPSTMARRCSRSICSISAPISTT